MQHMGKLQAHPTPPTSCLAAESSRVAASSRPCSTVGAALPAVRGGDTLSLLPLLRGDRSEPPAAAAWRCSCATCCRS